MHLAWSTYQNGLTHPKKDAWTSMLKFKVCCLLKIGYLGGVLVAPYSHCSILIEASLASKADRGKCSADHSSNGFN